MTLSHDTAHEAEAQARLCEQYKGNVGIIAILDAGNVAAQAVEDALWQLQTMRLPLSTATGAQLDGIGEIVGQSRQYGQSDTDYRYWLMARMLSNASVGEPERLLEIIDLITNDANALILVQRPPAALVIWIDGSLNSLIVPSLLADILSSAVAGGVNLQFVHSNWVNAHTFTFSSGDTEEASDDMGWSDGLGGEPGILNAGFDDWTGDVPDEWTDASTGLGFLNEVGSGEAHGGSGTGSINLCVSPEE